MEYYQLTDCGIFKVPARRVKWHFRFLRYKSYDFMGQNAVQFGSKISTLTVVQKPVASKFYLHLLCIPPPPPNYPVLTTKLHGVFIAGDQSWHRVLINQEQKDIQIPLGERYKIFLNMTTCSQVDFTDVSDQPTAGISKAAELSSSCLTGR
jgi:hypothetical protein